jgi:hypothetical protein
MGVFIYGDVIGAEVGVLSRQPGGKTVCEIDVAVRVRGTQLTRLCLVPRQPDTCWSERMSSLWTVDMVTLPASSAALGRDK